MRNLNLARIGRGDDRADRLLIETLESALALEIFQMTADRTVAQKALGLRRRDEARLLQRFDSRRRHRPASLTLGECLPEKVENPKTAFIVATPSCASRSRYRRKSKRASR